MSLAYSDGHGGALLWTVAVAGSVGLHLGFAARMLDDPAPPVHQAEVGATGAILFDLADVITAPSETGEASVAVAEAQDAPTVTDSPEESEAGRADDQPLLDRIPYEVEDDELKFAVASPDLEDQPQERAEEIATEPDEDRVDQPSTTGATAAQARDASTDGSDATDVAETSQARSEGLTAEEKAQIADWQKSVVVEIARAKSYPSQARQKRIEGEVRVRFTIDRYGAVLSRSVETPSGWPVLDRAALGVLDGIDKLPTPPTHLRGESFTLIVPINYRFR